MIGAEKMSLLDGRGVPLKELVFDVACRLTLSEAQRRLPSRGMAADAEAGATTIQLDVPEGWQVGDELFLPDLRQIRDRVWEHQLSGEDEGGVDALELVGGTVGAVDLDQAGVGLLDRALVAALRNAEQDERVAGVGQGRQVGHQRSPRSSASQRPSRAA